MRKHSVDTVVTKEDSVIILPIVYSSCISGSVFTDSENCVHAIVCL